MTDNQTTTIWKTILSIRYIKTFSKNRGSQKASSAEEEDDTQYLRLGIRENLYTILQVLSITVFEKTPLVQAVTGSDYKTDKPSNAIHLKLFD